MRKNKSEISVFVTDQSIGVFQFDAKYSERSNHKSVKMESGIVENGYLVDAFVFYRKLSDLFKELKIVPKRIRFVIQEQNVLIREMTIKKSDLQKKSLDNYLNEQKNKSLHFPFPNPLISHHVMSETTDDVLILAFIADESLLTDYYDVFERLGSKEVVFDMASLSLYHLYLKKTEYDLKNTLVVTIYDRMLTVHVFEDSAPIFSMIEELVGSGEAFYESIENYTERIANYYRYNLRKDKSTIYNALIFNLTERIDQTVFKEKMGLRLKTFISTLADLSEIDPILKDQPKTIQIAYASNLMAQCECKILSDFKVDRLSKIKFYSNYVMVLALAIFSFVALLFIPYQLLNQEIATQRNINASLELQLNALIAENDQASSYTDQQIDYSEAFDYIESKIVDPSGYITDLLSKISGSLALSNYQIDTAQKSIRLVVTATSEAELYEYLIMIYENYGLIPGSTDLSRWMTTQPEREFLSTYVMEVTVYYA